MATRRNAKKEQQDFFANMQTLFFGASEGGIVGEEGIVGQLKAAADDLRAASDMLRQSTQAQPTYGGPNGSRPRFDGDGTRRPKPHADFGMDVGYSSLRRTLATEAATRYGSTGGIFQRGNTFQPHYDRTGRIEHYTEVNSNGEVVGIHPRGSEEAQKGYARQQRASGIANLANAPTPLYTGSDNGPVQTPGVSTAQHIVNDTIGKIPFVGAPIAGLISGLIGLPDAVLNGIVNQRAKNAQYQSILGGTNFSTGFGQRLQEEQFKLSQLYSGGLTGSMSVEAFRGVTGLGYTGDVRDQALGFITSNYKNLGASVADSLKVVSIMAQSSSTAFDQLKATLHQVSDAAKNTGQNLELARNNFTNLFAIATQVSGGAGAAQTSGLLGTYQAQLGRNFANVNFSNLLPGVNPGLTALAASSVGMSISQYELATAGGGPRSRQLFQTGTDNLIARAVAPTVGQVQPIINQLVQQAGGIKAVTGSNDSWQRFVANVMQNPAFLNSGINLPALKAQIQAYTGAQVNDQQAIEYVLRGATGAGFSLQGVAKNAQAAVNQHQVPIWTHGNRLSAISGHPGWYSLGVASTIRGPLPAGEQYLTDQNGITHIAHRDTRARGTMTVDPILNAFSKGGFNNESTHIVVQTKDGPKVVTGKYAWEHFKDQIAKGTASFAGGKLDGKSIADQLGGGYGESNYKGDTTHLSGSDRKHFQSVSDYEKNHPLKENGGGGKVIIAPSPALAQLLQITATGNTTIANEGAQWGYVPKPGQTGTPGLGG